MLRMLLVLLALSLAGCLSRPPLSIHSFSFSPLPGRAAAATRTDRVLVIRRLTISAPFDNQSFVYRIGEYSYETDPYAQFLALPRECLLAAIRTDWKRDGAFRDVLDEASALRPNMIAEISVSQLYGDFRKLTEPASVLAMHFIFFAVRDDGQPGKVLLQKSYQQRIPLKQRTAAQVIAGWNQGLQKILTAVGEDLAHLDTAPGPANSTPSPQPARAS